MLDAIGIETPIRALIVVADPTWAEVLSAALTPIGYAVQIARDGIDGVAIAEAIDADCAVVDLILPGMSGLIVARRLSAIQRRTPITIIGLTSLRGGAVEAIARDAGVTLLAERRAGAKALVEILERRMRAQGSKEG